MIQKKTSVRCVVLWAALICGAAGSTADTINPDNLFDMSIEDLMDITVISSSRQQQQVNHLSVPVSVVTAEDIHYQGSTNIYEALAFVPGVDVFKINRNLYALGIHGLHDSFSDRTLTLINGRYADNPAFGGSEFMRQPVMMEDIERIEVVRGPGGAAWGANAFNGVINIITKKPADCKGFLTSTTWTEYGDSYNHLRHAGGSDAITWRYSLGYRDVKSSSDALDKSFVSDNPLTPGSLFKTHDFRRDFVFDGEIYNQINEQTRLSMGLGYSHLVDGDFEFATLWPRENGRMETYRTYLKLDHEFDNDTSGFLQWTGNFTDTLWPSLTGYRSYENDLEGQFNFKHDTHNITMGANARMLRINNDFFSPHGIAMGDNVVKEHNLGFYIIDNWEVTDRLTFEEQFRLDYYSETQIDWAGRFAALYALDDEKKHIVRIAAAKAFRTPRVSPRNVQSSRLFVVLPGPASVPLVTLNSVPNIKNEEVVSLEAGYSGIVSKSLIVNANAFVQWYDGLIGYEQTNTPLGPGVTQVNYLANNIGDATSFGFEADLSYTTDFGKFSAWYAYNDFVEEGVVRGNADDGNHQSMRAFTPAKNKFGINSRLFLGKGWTFNSNYKFTTFTSNDHADAPSNIPEHNRIDLTLAKEFTLDNSRVNGEVMVGISDLLNETEFKGSGQGFFYDNHVSPGRTIFARLQLRF